MYINPDEDPVIPKFPYFDWGDDENFRELVLYVNSPSRRVLHLDDIVTFPVTEEGYNRLSELTNVLDQMRQYMLERLAPDSKTCYNVAYVHNTIGQDRPNNDGEHVSGSASRAA